MEKGQNQYFDHIHTLLSYCKSHLFSIGGFLTLFVCCTYGLGIINFSELSAGITAKVLWTIIGMYIVGTALYESGDIENILTQSLEKHHRYSAIILRLFIPVTLMSGFMNNTPVVATFIPICKEVSKLKNIPVKKLLLPLSYAAILGGNLTFIGATTHIVLNEQLSVFSHLDPFPLTLITPLAVTISVFFYIYLYYFGYKILPDGDKIKTSQHDSPLPIEGHLLRKHIARFSFLFMIFLIVTGILHHFYAALLCAVIVIGTGCISLRSVLACFNPQLIMVIIASFPLSSFITNIGASEMISQSLSPLFTLSPFWLFLSLYCFIWILTEFLNNLAIALIALPIFISSEPLLNVPIEALLFLLMVASSSSFLTPIGYHTNIMVYSAGHYRLRDMILFGLPLGIISAVFTSFYCLLVF